MPHSELPQLHVNDGPLPLSHVGLMRVSTLGIPVEELRKRYLEDGYLLVKGIIPREDVLKTREEYFKFLAPCGVLKPGSKPVEGVFDPNQDVAKFPGIGSGAAGMNGHPGKQAEQFIDLALDAHVQDWYAEDLCRHPNLHRFVADLTGWGENCKGLRRSLLRNNLPNTKAIGVHYDQIFLRHGEPTSITAWVPIGDISITGGGLMYLENSESFGRQFEDDFTRNAVVSGLTEEQAKSAFNQNMLSTGLLTDCPAQFVEEHGKRWMVSSYEAGDVVFHTPFTIHASTLNKDPNNTIRLATDLRYVDASKPYDERWDHYYTLGDGV